MIKQVIKTVNGEFIRTRALSRISFVQFRRYATLFPRLFLSLTLMAKSKKTLEASLDLTPSSKTPLDERIESLVSNVDYLENRRRNLIQRKYDRKRHLAHTRRLKFKVAFEIQVLSTSAIKCHGDLRIFQLAEAICRQKICQRLSRNLCISHRQWLWHIYLFFKQLRLLVPAKLCCLPMTHLNG